MVGMLISVEEYLHTMYRPDCDYVDGEVLERLWGERSHSELQVELGFFLHNREEGRFVFPSLRIRISETRYRVPDLCVYVGQEPNEQIPGTPPFICIEILSPEDRMDPFMEKIDDYLKFGVPYVWVINPRSRRAWVYTRDSIYEAKDGILKTENPMLTIPLTEIFAALDRS